LNIMDNPLLISNRSNGRGNSLLTSAAIAILLGGLNNGAAKAQPVSPEARERIAAALPAKPLAEPARPRRLLVFTLTRGFRHASIPVGVEALTQLGRRTGAFEVTHSEDPGVFEPDSLSAFDAVCLLNTTGELFTPANLAALPPPEAEAARQRDARLKQSLLEFVRGGKGLAGIHSATDTFYEWPDYGRMIGGYFDGHPWNAGDDVVIRIDDPQHPLTAPLGGRSLEFKEEIYQLRDPYSRQRQRILMVLDHYRTDMSKPGVRRADNDFAVSWVRSEGRGRVFYCSLGHNEHIYWHAAVLKHYLAGLQFALGDLEAPSEPRAPEPESSAWRPLFNGRDLTGWKGLVGDPLKRAAMTADELARAQAEADQLMRRHWTVVDGELRFDGGGSHLCTAEDFGDVELRVEWKIQPGGDSGIYLRGSPQVQIWDPAQWSEGSGGLYNNQQSPSKPFLRADRPVGEWNEFRILMLGERVSVWLNNQLVVLDTPLENYWDRQRPIYPTGQIELQSHGSPLAFRNILARRAAPSEPQAPAPGSAPWRPLFNGRDLAGWKCKPGSWLVEDGALVRKGGGDIWTEDLYGDFVLELEFMFAPQANSGIFFRTGDLADPVQTGIELQVLDSHGKAEPGKHDCGAVYDIMAPRVNAVRKPGEWNHVVLVCHGSFIAAAMNGERIISLDLNDWTQPRRNPDGSENKFRTAYREMPRIGHIGFQDHGTAVSYRNIRLKPLAPDAALVPLR
jgi:type 1 glutamine amidotransferase